MEIEENDSCGGNGAGDGVFQDGNQFGLSR
jgi:hypothetical protein